MRQILAVDENNQPICSSFRVSLSLGRAWAGALIQGKNLEGNRVQTSFIVKNIDNVEVRKKQRESAFTIKCEKRLNPNH
jgi:hypothetical protein